ncbi:MAG: hypothetical protein R3E42_17120 [Burkholderiaceae bacterium]
MKVVTKMLKTLLLIALALALLLLLAGQLGMLQGQHPGDLGITDGRLKRLSDTPNSVSSQADLYPNHPQATYASIDPLPLVQKDPQISMEALSGAACEQYRG